jgi:fructokinase
VRRIFAIGETVLDIIFKNGRPICATPGGSILNTAVSLGRLGIDVHFISEYGNDKTGMIIASFLTSNNIQTDYIYRYPDFPSSLALAFLDEQQDASYQFYKNYPSKRLDIVFPTLTENDIVIFGAFYGMDPNIRTRLRPFLEHARKQNAIILYDPNFRKAHLPKTDIYRPIILENFKLADIVKGSVADFSHIFHVENSHNAWQQIRKLCDILIYTADKHDVEWYSPNVYERYAVPPLQPVSTIGAGDTFNAGIIYGLVAQGIFKRHLKNMPAQQRIAIIRHAIDLAGQVCMSYDNYIPYN